MNFPARVQVRAKFFFAGTDKFFLKGVTYGPFHPNEAGEFFGNAERSRQDFELIGKMGANLLRVYYNPPGWFLDLAAEHGLRVLITIPWTQHVAFLDQPKVRAGIVKVVEEAVRKNAGHPAVFGYLVGNEMPGSIVRWLGPGRVVRFIEDLINRARAQDPQALFSYANYPPTEYLRPQNVDFHTFNVYLERRSDFERYLARLQNLAGEKPLIFGEFGLDTIRHGEEKQGEVLNWHLEAVVRGGAAGTIFFSWTDEWFTGGMEIMDWTFGLVTRGRVPKAAYYQLRDLCSGTEPIIRKFPLLTFPSVSVIVCSYNGARTLLHCLISLDQLNYPDYEIVLVDDGSTDQTPELIANFGNQRKQRSAGNRTLPNFRVITQANMGLSNARNVGAQMAAGEIIAYTDCDCMVDSDWLYHLVGTLLNGDYAGVGGPNISPPALNWIQAAVAAAPGGPNHVLLTDVIAEHIPGCNMAFHKWAFHSVGGFDPGYRKAGDDVDFCWRVQSRGGVIAFSPAAVVWHYRRFTLQDFARQQMGYGEAESMLRSQHLAFFGPTGSAKWKGVIYATPRFNWLLHRSIIYHGVFGTGLFQSVYPAAQSEIAAYVSSLEWVALTVLFSFLAWPLPSLRVLPFLMFGATLLTAFSYMLTARIEPRFDGLRSRLLVGLLAWWQPLVRGWARYFTWMKFKRTPRTVIEKHVSIAEAARRYAHGGDLIFWNELGHGREALIAEVCANLENEHWKYATDTGWKNWDVQIYGNLWWMVQLCSVTEYHGGANCLTRVRFANRPTIATVLALGIPSLIVAYRQIALADFDLCLNALFLIWTSYLLIRAWRLKHCVGELVKAAALRCKLVRSDELS